MRLALFLLACVPIWAQVSIVLEPMSPSDADRLLGLKNHTVWTAYVSGPPNALVKRQEVTSLTAISELTYDASIDILEKESAVHGITVAALIMDVGLPITSTVLGVYGVSKSSKGATFTAGGLNIASTSRDLLRKQEPNIARHTPKLLPDSGINCDDQGLCGGWYVLTEKLPSPQRAEIPSPLIAVSVINGNAAERELSGNPEMVEEGELLVLTSQVAASPTNRADIYIKSAGIAEAVDCWVFSHPVVCPDVDMLPPNDTFAPSAGVFPVSTTNMIDDGVHSGFGLISAQTGKPVTSVPTAPIVTHPQIPDSANTIAGSLNGGTALFNALHQESAKLTIPATFSAEVGSILLLPRADLLPMDAVSKRPVIDGLTGPEAKPEAIRHRTDSIPIVTHPQIPDEDEARALWIAAAVRERSAMGAGN